MESKLRENRLKEFRELSSEAGNYGKHIRLLLEIVSAINFPDAADGLTPNPYVIVTLGSQEVHRTTPLHKT